jgi:hypothetical protein
MKYVRNEIFTAVLIRSKSSVVSTRKSSKTSVPIYQVTWHIIMGELASQKCRISHMVVCGIWSSLLALLINLPVWMSHKLDVRVTVHCDKFLIIKATKYTNFSNLFLEWNSCMFRTVPLFIIRSFSLYTQQWYMSYRFADCLWAGSGCSILILFATCQ